MKRVVLGGLSVCVVAAFGCDSGGTTYSATADAQVVDGTTVRDQAPSRENGQPGTEGGIRDLNPTCSSCHGSATNAAPPSGFRGQSETSDRAVGAHQVHLGSSSWHAQVKCEDCHIVPKTYTDPGHIDSLPPAEVTFSPAASADGAKPVWDGTTCANVYCHGGTLDGGQFREPVWTTVDGSQTKCTGCHGLPPGGTHPKSTACSLCHGDVINADMSFKAPELHINGKVEVMGGHVADYVAKEKHGADFNAGTATCASAACHGETLAGAAGPSCDTCHNGWKKTCNFCHGDKSDPSGAPPATVAGATGTSVRGVGAHQSHLKSSTWHTQLTCEQCHTVPTDAMDPGHIDATPAELNFTGIAVADSAKPAFNGKTCSGVYCHGATLSGAGATPEWTKVDGSQAKCGSCHGLPPGGTHTKSTACSMCHGAVVDSDFKIIAPQLHINGKVDVTPPHAAGYSNPTNHGKDFIANKASCQDAGCHGATLTGASGLSCETCHPRWKTNCIFCHGGKDNRTGAPPVAVNGDTSTTTLAVGQHSQHVVDSARHGAYPCATCHTMPTDALSPGHIDGGRAQVKFSGIAAGATYNAATGTCSNVYCHGNGRGTGGSASWTSTLSGACDQCHDVAGSDSTLGGRHNKHFKNGVTDCARCHTCVVNSDGTFNTPSRHVDGTADNCWPNTNSTNCSYGCHGNETW